MDAAQSKAAFTQAKALFAAKRYEQCIEILQRLDKVHPGNPQLLFPLAQSLAKIGQTAEASRLCDSLIEMSNHAGARKLRTELQPSPEPAMGEDLGVLDVALDFDIAPISSAFSAPPPLQQASAASGWAPYAIWCGLLASFFVLGIIMTQTLGEDAHVWLDEIQNSSGTSGETPAVPVASFIYIAIPNIAYQFLLACFIAYFALKFLRELPHEDFNDDMKDIALYTLFCMLLTPVLFIGWIVGFIILKRHYDLSFGRTVLLFFLWTVIGIGASIPGQLISTFFIPTS